MFNLFFFFNELRKAFLYNKYLKQSVLKIEIDESLKFVKIY